ncbi:unnamed protein product [Caenorhabditis brenneri]
MNANSGSLTVFLIFLVLMITISNLLTLGKTDLRLSETRAIVSEIQSILRNKPPSKSALMNQKILLDASKTMDNKDFYSKVKEEAFCVNKVRIGESGDGGKYVCNPKKVNKDDCTILSLGLNNQIGFDEHIFNETGGHCTLLGADLNEQHQPTKDKYTKMNGQLFSGRIPDQLPISEMMKKSGKKSVELMKIDIEGGEFTGLEPFIKEYFVCQIFIEIHGTPAKHLQMLQTIAKYKFRIFNVDPNPLCPLCCEYSLINEKCMEQFGVTPLDIMIP